MVRDLGVNELNEAVALVWGGDDGDIAADDREQNIELLTEEASLAWRRDGSKDGGAVGGVV